MRPMGLHEWLQAENALTNAVNPNPMFGFSATWSMHPPPSAVCSIWLTYRPLAFSALGSERPFIWALSQVPINVSALSEARFQEKVCTSTVLRRAFDKAVRRKPARGCGGRGPYANSIEGRCGVEVRRGCAVGHG